MRADDTLGIPKLARPSGDGRFLYRFRGYDYVLTRAQTLRQAKLARRAIYLLAGLGVIAALAVILMAGLGRPWLTLPMLGFLLSGAACLLWLDRRTRALLAGCERRALPRAKSLAARGLQWLEHNRSLYLNNNPRPLELAVYGLVSLGLFLLFTSSLWPPLIGLDGRELVMEAIFYLPIALLSLGFAAVSFYALCRTLIGKGTKGSGSDGAPET